MGNVEVAYSLTDDFHKKHLQCSDIRGYSIENGSVRRFVAQNVNVEMLFLKWECSLCLLLVLSNCSEPVGYFNTSVAEEMHSVQASCPDVLLARHAILPNVGQERVTNP